MLQPILIAVLLSLRKEILSAPSETIIEPINLKPDFAEAYFNRGNAYHDKDDYDRAIEDHREAIGLKPDFAAAYNHRGVAHRDRGDFDDAIADFNEALKLNPDDAEVYYNRGLAYRGQ